MSEWRRLPAVAAVVFGMLVGSTANGQVEPAANTGGSQAHATYLSFEPYEVLDSQSAQIALQFTDLVLPGDHGRDLAFSRYFSVDTWYWGIAGYPMSIEDNGDALEPYLYYGTAPSGSILVTRSSHVDLVMADGGRRRMLFETLPDINNASTRRFLLSTERFRYDRWNHRLQMPDGRVCYYETQAGYGMSYKWLLTRCEDPFGQYLEVTYDYAPMGHSIPCPMVVRQFLSGGRTREVTFGVTSSPEGGQIDTMTYLGRQWRLSFNINYANLNQAWYTFSPPLGGDWIFELIWQYWPDHEGYLLKGITTPGDAHIDYTYAHRYWGVFNGGDQGPFLDTRVVSGAGAPSATWTFTDYEFVAPRTSVDLWRFAVVSPFGDRTGFSNCLATDYTSSTFSLVGPEMLTCATVYPLNRTVTTNYERRRLITYPSNVIAGVDGIDVLVPTLTRWWNCDEADENVCDVQTTIREYDANLRVAESHETNESFPGLERVTTTTYCDVGVTVSGCNLNGQLYLYGLPLTSTMAIGTDAVTTTQSYDANGFTVAQTAGGVTTTFVPDTAGNVQSETTAGRVTTYTYDWGVVKTVGTPAHTLVREINPDGTIASEKEDTSSGARTTTYQYDPVGRLTVVTPPGGAPASVTAYDDVAGSWVTMSVGTVRTKTTLDGLGRVIRTETGTTSAYTTRQAQEYDEAGRLKRQSLPVAVNAADVWTTYTYDALGRVRQETLPDGHTRTYTPGRHSMTVVDEEGHATTTQRQEFGVPDSGSMTQLVDAANQTWTYTYDVVGALTGMAGPNAVTRTWTYDAPTRRLISQSHPEDGTVTYPEYWNDGALKKKIDARGTTFEYTYDTSGRDATVTVTPAGGTAELTTFTYEPGSDRLASVTTPDVTTTYHYDAAGRLDQRTDVVDGHTFTTGYAYDAQENVSQLTYPSGRVIKFAYDAETQLMRVCRGNGTCDANTSAHDTLASDFVYEPSGALYSYRGGNGIVTTFTHDAQRARLTRIVAGSGEERLDLTYSYDGVGNVLGIEDATRPQWTQTFTYDALDRLTTASSTAYGPLTYTYDPHGNRQTANGIPYTYAATNRFRLEHINNGSLLTYDANGNLTGGFGGTYAYTPLNQVKTATVSGTATQYVYDADQWRIKKAVSGAPVAYSLRGADGTLLTQWSNASPKATVQDYIYANGLLLGVITSQQNPK